MLDKILKYSKNLNLPPFQYSRGMNHWVISIDNDGNFESIEPIIRETKNGKIELGDSLLPATPHRNRNGNAPKLIVDTCEYVFGLGTNSRSVTYHEAYIEMLKHCWYSTNNDAIDAIIKFLLNEPIPICLDYIANKVNKDSAFSWSLDPGHVVRFLVDKVDPTQDVQIQEFWADYFSSNDVVRGQCLVCGQESVLIEKVQHKLRGIPNTQKSGAYIISAYSEASHSYGKKGIENSPICIDCGEKISQGLSGLESNKRHNLKIGGLLYFYWSEKEYVDLNQWFGKPTLEDVQQLISYQNYDAVPSMEIDLSEYYILLLTAGSGKSSGRIAVRDYLETTVPRFKKRLRDWFSWQELIGLNNEINEPLGIYSLAMVAFRDASKDMDSVSIASLCKAALTGSSVSKNLLHKVIERTRIQKNVTYRQAILIKVILISLGIDVKVRLDMDMNGLTPGQKVAYLCGRLLATFGTIQYYALGSLNSTVIDKCYGAAATTPNKVFGHLGIKTQHHLTELRHKRKYGLAIVMAKQLEEIYSMLPSSLPNNFTLEEQGLFAMGYWHQKAYRKFDNNVDNTIDGESGQDSNNSQIISSETLVEAS